jgi:hypothetical protein
MSEYVAISSKRHADMRWHRQTNFTFASEEPVAALVLAEIAQAMMAMPIAFMLDEQNCVPVAVLGLKPGENNFVSSSGQWLGDYVPLAYRVYPFRLGRDEQGTNTLCIDEAAARVGHSVTGERFFDESGAPEKALQEIADQLVQIERDRVKTVRACEVLRSLDMFEPWPLTIKDGGEPRNVSGLYRASETMLYKLSPDSLVALRDSGGLVLALGQLFSMLQVQQFAKLLGRQTQAGPALKLFDNNGIVSFGNL